MQKEILLASASPRRRTLLEAACFTVEVHPPNASEQLPGGRVEHDAIVLAERKLASVETDGRLALAADTLVVRGGVALGKPHDAAHAVSTLQTLSGRQHRVVTGCCVSYAGRRRAFSVTTQIWFRQLSSEEIERYVATGECMDKAGAYGIQGVAGVFVERIEGSYTNVIGLPVAEVIGAIAEVS